MDEPRYLTVTALTKYIKAKFDYDSHLKKVLLKGEISNFKHHSRGHFYFTLKDDKAQISAIMFASSASKVPFRPEDGMSVLVEGNVSVYEASGNYQIYVNKMSEEGLGNLYLAYEQLKKKLAEEGLFDDRHKQPIPAYPKAIAVLTSPTGAAVRDIIHIINRRYPLTRIIVYPTLVQGEYAKDNIVENLNQVNRDGLVDVIILGRGGGSIEDLWPFNEEVVARAIFASTIPIISAVGHETDYTISDFVADKRAPTPSGAAEIAVRDQIDLRSELVQRGERAKHALKRLLQRKQERLTTLRSHYALRDPLRLLEGKIRALDHAQEKLRMLHPGIRLQRSRDQLRATTRQLHERMRRIVDAKRNEFILHINQLEWTNPLSIMNKGYSVTRKDGVIIKTVDAFTVGDRFTVSLADGQIEATADAIRKEDNDE